MCSIWGIFFSWVLRSCGLNGATCTSGRMISKRRVQVRLEPRQLRKGIGEWSFQDSRLHWYKKYRRSTKLSLRLLLQ
jgi:hypothetical protein